MVGVRQPKHWFKVEGGGIMGQGLKKSALKGQSHIKQQNIFTGLGEYL